MNTTPNWLYVDDERNTPPEYNLRAYTAEAALKMMRSGMEIDGLSLDHDLGVCPECQMEGRSCYHDGYWLLKQMAQEGLWPVFRPMVHSMNPVGAANMRAFINRHFPG